MHNGFLRPRTATDAAGKTQRGTLQAEGQKQVRQWLREQKLMPVSITETRETAAGGKAKTGVKLSTPVLSMFTRQLSTLVNAALPLESALKAISKQTEDKKLAAMVVEIREKVVEGHTLFDAFSQFPRTFDKLYCTLVMAGEKTGHLGRRAGKAGGVQRAAPEDEKQADAGDGLPDNPHRGRHRGHQHPAGGGGAAGDRAVHSHEAAAADHHPDADCGK